jgi:NADH-quinone oxidoreductase subunit A
MRLEASMGVQRAASDMHDYYASYVPVLFIVLIGTALVCGIFVINRLLRPSHPTYQKVLTYESGVDPVGAGWAQVHMRYYVYAYLYVVFAVDVMFLFPWATVFEQLGFATLVEMGVFVGVLALGLGYTWREGALSWT